MSSSTNPVTPEKKLQELRAGIARRKRGDRIFGIVGCSLIFLSLGVLLLLVANLVREGYKPLAQTHEVKIDESSYALGELAGTLKKSGDAWTLELPKLTLELTSSDATDAQQLVGQVVRVDGRLPRGADTEMSVSSIAPESSDKKFVLQGTLERATANSQAGENGASSGASKDIYVLTPQPLTVSQGAVPVNRFVDGARVAIKPVARPANNAFVAKELTPLRSENFFTSFPSRFPEKAGILSAWVGTLLVMLVTIVLAVPLGVAAGVYLEEYAPKNKLTAILEVNIANLAGVPSIIWGLMALGLFVYFLGFGRSIQTAGMTLGLLVLPIVIIATREAIRSIPAIIREASIGLGATKWQTTRYHIIPYSLPGILTGAIIALSRAIGETAPLVTIGALTFIAFLPPAPVSYAADPAEVRQYEAAIASGASMPEPEKELSVQPKAWLRSEFTVMPIQLFQWISRPQKEFHENAAAAGVILLGLTLGLNGFAIFVRYRLRKGIKW